MNMLPKKVAPVIIVFVIIVISSTDSKRLNLLSHLDLSVDFFRARNIKFCHILTPNSASKGDLRDLFECLSKSGISVGLHNRGDFLKVDKDGTRCNTGVIDVWNEDSVRRNDTFYDEVSGLKLFRHFAWLIIADGKKTEAIVDKFRFTTLALDADLMVAIVMIGDTIGARVEEKKFLCKSSNQTTTRNDHHQINYNTSQSIEDSQIFLPFYRSNITEPTNNEEELTNLLLPTLKQCHETMDNSSIELLQNNNHYCLLQLYKIRKELNNSLVVHPLGLWTTNNRIETFRNFILPEYRTNFKRFPLKCGWHNSTTTVFDHCDDHHTEKELMEFANYFRAFLNASAEVIQFQRTGTKDTDGDWSDFLGAVVKEEVDIGLALVGKSAERLQDMEFTHKILDSSRNLYIKPQESNELRDIVITPFSPNLTLCVIGIGVIVVCVISLINKFSNCQENRWNFGEASISCVGIIAMQGTTWKPVSFSGKIILITSLMLAVIIFNSYSAFITSILSVKIDNIRSVKDLLESDYDIGYTKNSPDELFLRETNDSQLQQIYLRGYLKNTVTNMTEGLMKSKKGRYGFFASVIRARRQLLKLDNYKCNRDLHEIKVYATRNTIAFPLSSGSPIKKLINLSIIKMYETGVYKHIQLKTGPILQKCQEANQFRGAHLMDLMTAFGVLIIGLNCSLLIMICECLWAKKRKIRSKIRTKKTSLVKSGEGGQGQGQGQINEAPFFQYRN